MRSVSGSLFSFVLWLAGLWQLAVGARPSEDAEFLWPSEEGGHGLPEIPEKVEQTRANDVEEEPPVGAWDNVLVDESPIGASFKPASVLELNMNSSSGAELPTDFFPHRVYDGNPWDFEGGFDPVLSMQSAMFRWISSASYRASTHARMWCYSTWKVDGKALEDGRPYLFSDFRAFTIHLLQLYRALNFDPACGGVLDAESPTDSSDRWLAVRNSPLYRLETLLRKQTELPDDDWWGQVFLPQLVEAFSCGFSENDRTVDDERKEALPLDIKADFEGGGTNYLIPKIWRLMKGYLMSPQKQRENIIWQGDFAVSLYVPFMRKHIPGYDLCTDDDCWTSRAMMRCGAPTYVGPAIWYVFHTMAHAVAQPFKADETGSACDDARAALFNKFKATLAFFALAGQPCPYCREHFLTQVSRNDQESSRFLQHSLSESNQYPLEWLFLGVSPEGVGGDPASKLATITPEKPNSIKLFFWKLHNAVTSSVKYGKDCRQTEQWDEELFRCTTGGFPQMGRAWPFARRFAYSLPAGQWDKLRHIEPIQIALKRLQMLDKIYLRQHLWVRPNRDLEEARSAVEYYDPQLTGDSDEDPSTLPFDQVTTDVKAVLATLVQLDKAIEDSEVLDRTYEGGVPDSAKFGTCSTMKSDFSSIFDTFTEAPGPLEMAPWECQKVILRRT